jgi:RNA polymerase sigma factor (sigma-70 family)
MIGAFRYHRAGSQMHPPTIADDLDKKELLSQAIERDTDKLLAGIRNYLWRFGLARDRHTVQALAREVLHEAFITVVQNCDRYDPTYPAYPWVLQAALNHIRNLRRKQGREVLLADEACRRGADPGISEEEMIRILTQSVGPAPGEGPSAAELLSLAEGEERELLRLHDLEGVDYDELAKRFGVSPGTVRQRVCRARRHVREAYQASKQFEDGDN